MERLTAGRDSQEFHGLSRGAYLILKVLNISETCQKIIITITEIRYAYFEALTSSKEYSIPSGVKIRALLYPVMSPLSLL